MVEPSPPMLSRIHLPCNICQRLHGEARPEHVFYVEPYARTMCARHLEEFTSEALTHIMLMIAPSDRQIGTITAQELLILATALRAMAPHAKRSSMEFAESMSVRLMELAAAMEAKRG